MCGIAGWYRRGRRPVPAAVIAAQCGLLRHRGPDDEGFLVDDDFGFGMRRLSIQDVAGGHQPMTRGHYAIVFNGEIYNHRELRGPLGEAGYRFAGHSDTETILAAYAHWGDAAWERLEGMFAVAIWDRLTRTLTLARDPLGIKPLYLTEQQGGLAFASELKALRGLPGHRFDVDDRAVHDVLSFGHVRMPRSIFRQVGMVAPGHRLTLAADGPARIAPFWRPRLAPVAGLAEREWIEQMRHMLRTTTRRHMLADVPVAAFLSGGIDSSAVLAAMRAASDAPIKAFTIGHPGARIDETRAAAEIARHLGCEHIVAPLDPAETADALPAILRCYDEPFADMAAIPTWFAAKRAAEHVKVVLCGEGGDELFAGYKRHRNARLIERLRPLIGRGAALGRLAEALPVTGSARLNLLRQHARRAAEFARLPDGYQQFFAATRIGGAGLRRTLYTADFRASHDDSEAALEAEHFGSAGSDDLSALDQFLLADLTLNMPSAMLTRLDRASMAHSVEARVPLLSHRLVDWALTVPGDLKMRRGTGKHILRQAIRPWLPPSVFRRPKQGFQIPIGDWLRGGFGAFARDVWEGSGVAVAGYLDRATVARLFEEHARAEADHGRILYAITALSLWLQDRRVAAADAIADVA